MKDLPRPYFFDDNDGDFSPQDDIDQLFLQLEPIKPPPSLVDTILASVAHLPRHEFLSDVDDTKTLWHEIDDLIVRNPHLQPS